MLMELSNNCACYKRCPYIHTDLDGDFWCMEECMDEDAEAIDWSNEE